MNYRVFYVLSNEEIDLNKITNTKFKIAKNDNLNEIKLFFNEDMLNVLSDSSYKRVNEFAFMYGFAIENNQNILYDIKDLFGLIFKTFNHVDIIFDTGSKRYINNYEFEYYTTNIMPIDKLFNIDISSSKYKTEYKTVGLKSMSLDEIKMYSSDYYSTEIYKKFKNYVIHSVANNNFPLLMIKEECNVIDETELLQTNYEFNTSLNILHSKHLVDNYINFFKLYKELSNNKKFCFTLNNRKVNDLSTLPNPEDINYLNFRNFLNSYEIIVKDMTYNHLNIFYALKYLK